MTLSGCQRFTEIMNVLSQYRNLMALADVAGFASCPAYQAALKLALDVWLARRFPNARSFC
jgi:hypothetical protein